MGLFDFLKKKELQEIKDLKELLHKYQPIIDVDDEAERKRSELEKLIEQKNLEISKIDSDLKKLNTDYQQALEVYSRLERKSAFMNLSLI